MIIKLRATDTKLLEVLCASLNYTKFSFSIIVNQSAYDSLAG